MSRIWILTCSNCTQELDCASVVCLRDMRKRKGFFERYKDDKDLTLVGIINCAGCPTLGAPDKILRKVKSLASFRVDTIHLSYCMTALCPLQEKICRCYKRSIPWNGDCGRHPRCPGFFGVLGGGESRVMRPSPKHDGRYQRRTKIVTKWYRIPEIELPRSEQKCHVTRQWCSIR